MREALAGLKINYEGAKKAAMKPEVPAEDEKP
jgi:hypothetical protein